MVTEPDAIVEVNCLFQQPWWLEALAPGQWNAAIVNEGGRVVARMPYVTRRRYGLNVVGMPPLTQALGAWFAPLEGKYERRLARTNALTDTLLEQLPAFDFFKQNLHYSIDSWLPYYWRGFHQTTRYTYILRNLVDTESIWKGCSESTRRAVRKGRRKLEVRDGLDVEEFLRLNRMTFDRQGMVLPYSEELVYRLDAACKKNSCRHIIHVVDSKERTHAAVYLVWDERSAYYLMGGSDPEFRDSAGMSLALWEAIEYSARVTNEFNFEGSIIRPIEKFFRGYGAVLTPYLSITGMSRRMRFLKAVNDGIDAIKGGAWR